MEPFAEVLVVELQANFGTALNSYLLDPFMLLVGANQKRGCKEIESTCLCNLSRFLEPQSVADFTALWPILLEGDLTEERLDIVGRVIDYVQPCSRRVVFDRLEASLVLS